MFNLIQDLCSLQTASKYRLLRLRHLKIVLIKWSILPLITTVNTHTHIPQMPISAQQSRLAIGRANAFRSLRSHMTGQSKMKLTSWDVFLFTFTSLMRVLLSGDGVIGEYLQNIFCYKCLLQNVFCYKCLSFVTKYLYYRNR